MSREDRIETIRSEIDKGEYLTDEKIDAAVGELQREVQREIRKQERAGYGDKQVLVVGGVCILICITLLAVQIWQMIWGSEGPLRFGPFIFGK